MTSWKGASLALIAFACVAPRQIYAQSMGCDFRRIAVDPVETVHFERYVGKGQRIEIEFSNETGRDASVFPEPPLRVRSGTGSPCEIDGGIWVRSGVFLSIDEQYLMVQEYSGSAESLVIYETSSCSRRYEIDVSQAHWRIDSNKITIGKMCSDKEAMSCREIRIIALNDRCAPEERQRKEN